MRETSRGCVVCCVHIMFMLGFDRKLENLFEMCCEEKAHATNYRAHSALLHGSRRATHTTQPGLHARRELRRAGDDGLYTSGRCALT